MTDHLEAQLAAQARDIEHLQRTLTDLQQSGGGGDPDLGPDDAVDEPPPQLRFDSLEAFVDGFVEVHYERPSHTEGNIKWFRCWPAHPSVVWVMEILWSSFEEARAHDLQDGGGSNSAGWMTTTFIPLMEWVCAHDGPMGLCSAKTCDGANRLGQVPTYATARVA